MFGCDMCHQMGLLPEPLFAKFADELSFSAAFESKMPHQVPLVSVLFTALVALEEFFRHDQFFGVGWHPLQRRQFLRRFLSWSVFQRFVGAHEHYLRQRRCSRFFLHFRGAYGDESFGGRHEDIPFFRIFRRGDLLDSRDFDGNFFSFRRSLSAHVDDTPRSWDGRGGFQDNRQI